MSRDHQVTQRASRGVNHPQAPPIRHPTLERYWPDMLLRSEPYRERPLAQAHHRWRDRDPLSHPAPVVLPAATYSQIRLQYDTQPDPAQVALPDRLGVVLPKRI
jgi:hypothetical protein